MDYKKIFKSRKLRHAILRGLSLVPDGTMLKVQYKMKHGRKLDLKNPKRFTEKLQWYKINYRNDILHQCVDKYAVREYVEQKGLDDILVGLYGVYDSVDDVDVSTLPEKFVLKTTNGGGGLNVFICKNKSTFDKSTVKEQIGSLKEYKHGDGGREWAYIGVKPRIIVEEYLENPENPDAGVNDYKFLCFNGKPEYVIVDANRYIDHKRNFYDIDWTYRDVSSDHDNFGDIMGKPEGYEDMVAVAAKLSEGFPFVRVDLYNVKGKTYFGELTFYPWSGYVQFTPDEFDFELGEKILLPEVKK